MTHSKSGTFKDVEKLEKELNEVKKDMVKLIKAITSGYLLQNENYGDKKLTFDNTHSESAKDAMNNLNDILLKYKNIE